MRTNRIILSLAMAAFLLLVVTPGVAQGPYYAVGSVSIDMTSVAAGVGASWGGGVLRFKGNATSSRLTASAWAAWGFRPSAPWAMSTT